MQYVLPALILIALSPFLWLYEQIGPEWFWGIPASGIAIRQLRHQFILKRRKADKEAAKKREIEAKSRKRLETQQEFAERIHRQAQENIHAREQRESARRVHVAERDDGSLEVAWREQMEEVKRAWKNGDFDFARTWLQKMAYTLTAAKAPEAVHDKFKALMVAFTRDDPLYTNIMSQVVPAIKANPGVVQSTLAKRFSEYDAEHFRYALYFAAESGDIVRVKKGRSYALTLPNQQESKSVKSEGMRLDTPLDLPGHSFIDQLKWLETWACLPKGILTQRVEELAAAWDTEQGMTPVILQCVNGKPWVWPAYEAYAKENNEECEDEARQVKDMAKHVYRKYQSNHRAHHRKLQIDTLTHMRPYWELCGRCASPTGDENATLILDADDTFWDTHRVPWHCDQLDCRCYVNSLSEYERNHP
ncbi:hypothetical protein A1507_22625 [Methylomonas koyamae]|uniref:Uncharacterized protein n=1 Tax=Methylomonas koyamae TaxID=702114 RepID=A0A177NRY1_9GAMM|nr:hypothetical protein [Methylomonas koyamae]OAI20735.1 hypothetical protein A1507_22625 [Methylomonas koyamae]